VKLTVTTTPVEAGLGVSPVIVTTGAASFTVSEVLADPVPAEFEPETVIVKLRDFAFPVEE